MDTASIDTASKWELLLLSPCGAVVEQLLEPRDAQRLALSSKLLLTVERLLRRHSAAKKEFPPLEGRSKLATAVHNAIFRGGRKARQRGRLSVGQVAVLLDQLLLVASGIRPSCLVDHCVLEVDTATTLLNKLQQMEPLRLYHDVAAVFMSGNTFFINVPVFVREKFMDIASDFSGLLLVNASSDASSPTLIPNLHYRKGISPVNPATQVADAVRSVCKELLETRAAQSSRAVKWIPQVQLSDPAIAGLLLCYPVVYDVTSSRDNGDFPSDEWAGRGNCLAMCPLAVIQSGIRCELRFFFLFADIALGSFKSENSHLYDGASFADEPELPLQSFSIPVELLKPAALTANITSSRQLSMLQVLKAGTRRRIAKAISASKFHHQAPDFLRIRVDATIETLARVAI